jgi:hypothetical protein
MAHLIINFQEAVSPKLSIHPPTATTTLIPSHLFKSTYYSTTLLKKIRLDVTQAWHGLSKVQLCYSALFIIQKKSQDRNHKCIQVR